MNQQTQIRSINAVIARSRGLPTRAAAILRNGVNVLVLGFACATPTLLSASTAGASIAGQVSNAATGSDLEGAVMILVGTDRCAITDRGRGEP